MDDQDMFLDPSHTTSDILVEEDLQQDELDDTDVCEIVLWAKVQASDRR